MEHSVIKKDAGKEQSNTPLQRKGQALADHRPQAFIRKKQVEALATKNNAAPVQQKANDTGLPDQLKSGIESLSGISMDDVNVHYNSSQPAQLQAHAYAQGSDIHVAPGQEKHLPHEAWHVVQQKQGRVKPTMQLKSRVNVNDDRSLESEADMMGAKAMSAPRSFAPASSFVPSGTLQQKAVAQLARTKQTARKKAPTSKKRTVSGHGGIRRDALDQVVKFKVPKGKRVMRPAPPGATFGDLSMYLNTLKSPKKSDLLKKIIISTTTDLWGNIKMIKLIKAEPSIKKTQKQDEILDSLEDGTATFGSLTGGEKSSLAALEKKKEFEQWATGMVMPHAFQEFGENDEMEDMKFEPFEKELRSKKKNDENDYVENDTFLSDYVSGNPQEEFLVNACSYDKDCDFTGFQIDEKKKKK